MTRLPARRVSTSDAWCKIRFGKAFENRLFGPVLTPRGSFSKTIEYHLTQTRNAMGRRRSDEARRALTCRRKIAGRNIAARRTQRYDARKHSMGSDAHSSDDPT
jgi:hypothetical protein